MSKWRAFLSREDCPVFSSLVLIVTNNPEQPPFPDFFPPEFAAEIEEPAAREMMRRMQRTPLQVPGLGVVQTAFVGPAHDRLQPFTAADAAGVQRQQEQEQQRPAFVLLHGFDSSSLEFRRFHPLLSELGDVWAVDLAGGFVGWLAGVGRGPRIACVRWLPMPPPPLPLTTTHTHTQAGGSATAGLAPTPTQSWAPPRSARTCAPSWREWWGRGAP